ncbi:MAG: Phosphoglycerate mutase [Candidatus Saccharibacteria bacterium]|nr:Phosphoglycerate mutase [Candidatus Saccharibacteria bacterium]
MIDAYFIRHGMAKVNEQHGYYGGRSNASPLNEVGVHQSIVHGLDIARHGLMPDVVIASPAVRTRDTATLALQAAGVDLNLLIEPRFQEVSQGSWEGQLRKKCMTRNMERRAVRLGDRFKAPGGESNREVRNRVLEAVHEEIEPLNIPGQTSTVFVYGHAYASKLLYAHLAGWDFTHMRSQDIPHTSMTQLRFDDHDWLPGVFGRMAYELDLESEAS